MMTLASLRARAGQVKVDLIFIPIALAFAVWLALR